MLIDINASVGHWPFRKTYLKSCKDLLARMNKYGVDISVVSNINGIFIKTLKLLMKNCIRRRFRSYLKRFIPFAIINPIYAGWKDDIYLPY